MKRVIVIILAAAMLVLCACGSVPDDDGTAVETYLPSSASSEISLYTDGSAAPFKAVSSEDRLIVRLVYDSLIAIKNDFSTENLLAESYYLSDNLLTVMINKNAVFSDGSPFDGDALLYAVSRLEGTEYDAFYQLVSESAVVSPNCVQFTLSSVPSAIEKLLTFPIVSESGAGIGAYRFSDESTLVPNESYYGAQATLSRISLVTGDKTELYNDKKISFLYNDGSVPYSELDHTVTEKNISTTKLTFLGLNFGKRFLSTAEARNAFSCLIDRTAISSFAPQGSGYVTFSVIHPCWYKYDSSVVSAKYSTAEATEILASSGVEGASVNILVNSENIYRVMVARKIADTLSELGSKASVSSVAWDSYLAQINAGTYDIYVGETELPYNMNISAFLPSYSAFSSVSEQLAALSDDMPVIPLFFEQEALLSNGTAKLAETEPLLTAVEYK